MYKSYYVSLYRELHHVNRVCGPTGGYLSHQRHESELGSYPKAVGRALCQCALRSMGGGVVAGPGARFGAARVRRNNLFDSLEGVYPIPFFILHHVNRVCGPAGGYLSHQRHDSEIHSASGPNRHYKGSRPCLHGAIHKRGSDQAVRKVSPRHTRYLQPLNVPWARPMVPCL